MRLTLIQHAPRLHRGNLETVVHWVRTSCADVVVLPELALNGYWLQDKLLEDAWRVEELAPLLEASRDRDIVVGAAVWEGGRVYNSALYCSGGEILHIHHKNHLPTYGMFEEGRYFASGVEMRSFDTPHGRAAMVVCEDLWRRDTLMRLGDVALLYVLAASPARHFSDDGIEIEQQWDALLRSSALLSHAHVVFVNRVGFEDGLGFWGGSRVITPQARTQAILPHFDLAIHEVQIEPHVYAIGRYLAQTI